MLAGEARRHNLALDAAMAEAARHQDAVHAGQPRGDLLLLQLLAVNPVNLDCHPLSDARVVQRLLDADVGVVELDVLADDGDAQARLGGADALHQTAPVGQVGLAGGQA